jgi:hypothetical protein
MDMFNYVISIIMACIGIGGFCISAVVMHRGGKKDFAIMVEQQSRQSLLTEQLIGENRKISDSVRKLADSYTDVMIRLATVEYRLTTAHDRIDDLVKFTDMLDGRH